LPALSHFSFEFPHPRGQHPRASPPKTGATHRDPMTRTHHCNELRPAHIGQTVTLEGWVHSRRDLGGVIFIDVRDREGRTQTVFDPSDLPKDLFENAAGLRPESVIRVTGRVRQRPAGTNNPKIPSGEVEVLAKTLDVLNLADPLPFQIDDPEAAAKVNEEMRLKYRYLDLRRPEMLRNLRLRSRVATATRVFMEEQGFLEVETPILFKSTPEGAREFIVPTLKAALRSSSSCRTGVSRARFTRCRNRPSSSSKSSWWAGWSATTSWPGVFATRTNAPTASSNSRRLTSR
jgi:lysyl-tRNA synthetase class II